MTTEALPTAADSRPFAEPRQRMLVPLIVACALFMENLDSTVLATALPAIARSLDENPLHLNLAISAYLFSLAVFIPVSGWVADRFGARTVFRGAIGIFLLGSVLCGLSPSLPAFVAARILQGMGGALMVPVGRLVLLRSVPKSELVSAMAYLTIPALIGPVVGPPLGGFIATYLSWRWIFWINIPVGILGIILATRFIPAIREKHVPPLDVAGLLLTAIALTGLVFGFETTGRDILPAPLVVLLLVVGATAALVYVAHARRATHPIIDLSLLRIATFRASVTGGSMFRIGIGAIPFLLPMMLQIGFHRTPFESGMLTFAAALGAMGMKTTAARILRRFGFRRVLIANAVVSSAFLAAALRSTRAAWGAGPMTAVAPQPASRCRAAGPCYVRFRPRYPAALIEALARRCGLDGSGRLLDLGCGPGFLAIALAPHVAEAVGMDPEPEMLSLAAAEAEAAGVRLTLVEGGSTDLGPQ